MTRAAAHVSARFGCARLLSFLFLGAAGCGFSGTSLDWSDQLVGSGPCYDANLLDGLDIGTAAILADNFGTPGTNGKFLIGIALQLRHAGAARLGHHPNFRSPPPSPPPAAVTPPRRAA